MIHYTDTFDMQVERAEHYVTELKDSTKKRWFRVLLSILKQKKYARVYFYDFIPSEDDMRKWNWTKEDFLKPVDVSRIAYTYEFASFFDMAAREDRIEYSILPKCIEKLVCTIY